MMHGQKNIKLYMYVCNGKIEVNEQPLRVSFLVHAAWKAQKTLHI